MRAGLVVIASGDLLPEYFVRWSRSIRRSLVTPTTRRSTSCLCFAMTQPPAQSERIHALNHHPRPVDTSQASVEQVWGSPAIVEACSIRRSYVRDTKKV